jgi:hypothetical protein
MEAPNRYLHGTRPIDALVAGRDADVMEAAEALNQGAYL